MVVIEAKGMEFYAFHGYFPEERKAGQWYFVDVSIHLDKTIYSNTPLSNTIDYTRIYQSVARRMKISTPLLENIIADLYKEFKEFDLCVEKVEIEIRKQSPALGGRLDFTAVAIR